MLRNAHLIMICGLCAAPLVLDLPRKVRIGMEYRERGGTPHWPPYFAPQLRSTDGGLRALVEENEVVFSDQPWAVAWYADRTSIWLPPTKGEFINLESIALDQGTPVAGIHISPSSHNEQPVSETVALYRDFAPLVLNGGVFQATRNGNDNPGVTIHDKSARITEISSNYPYLRPLLGFDMIFYGNRIEADPKP